LMTPSSLSRHPSLIRSMKPNSPISYSFTVSPRVQTSVGTLPCCSRQFQHIPDRSSRDESSHWILHHLRHLVNLFSLDGHRSNRILGRAIDSVRFSTSVGEAALLKEDATVCHQASEQGRGAPGPYHWACAILDRKSLSGRYGNPLRIGFGPGNDEEPPGLRLRSSRSTH
jgi:hypothetical protein